MNNDNQEILSQFQQHESIVEDFESSQSNQEFQIHLQYNPQFKQILNHFRWIVNQKEFSERGMALSKIILKQIVNSYPTWDYRKDYLLIQNNSQLYQEEIEYTQNMILKAPKGFQKWYHLQYCYEQMPTLFNETCLDFTEKVLEQDERNYHCWKFNIYESEYKQIKEKIKKNVINNSLWSYYVFIIESMNKDRKEERQFGVEMMKLQSDNESVWSFLSYIYSDSPDEFTQIINQELINNPKNRFALAQQVFIEEKKVDKNIDLIKQTLSKLQEIDYLRRYYWQSYYKEDNQ